MHGAIGTWRGSVSFGLATAAIAAILFAASIVTRAAEIDPRRTLAAGDPACCVDMWAPGAPIDPMWGRGRAGPWHDQRVTRHRKVMLDGLPIEYQGLGNPLAATPAVLGKGRALYATRCASCHGPRGGGDGDAGKGLSPPPALLTFLQTSPGAVDGYLMWTVSEGGVALGTDMPAFKDALTEDEIWRVVAYMRGGFPAAPRGKTRPKTRPTN